MRWYSTLINQSDLRMTFPQPCLSFCLTFVTHYLLFFISTLQKIIVISPLYHKNRNNSNFQNILSYAFFLTIARYFQRHFDLFLAKRKRLTPLSIALFNVFGKIFLSLVVRHFLFFKPFFTTLFKFLLSNYFFLWFNIFEVVT